MARKKDEPSLASPCSLHTRLETLPHQEVTSLALPQAFLNFLLQFFLTSTCRINWPTWVKKYSQNGHSFLYSMSINFTPISLGDALYLERRSYGKSIVATDSSSRVGRAPSLGWALAFWVRVKRLWVRVPPQVLPWIAPMYHVRGPILRSQAYIISICSAYGAMIFQGRERDSWAQSRATDALRGQTGAWVLLMGA